MAQGPQGGPTPMNLLKSVETTIANLLEGAFGRMFRSEVRPVELARKLTREMDANRTQSLSRTYAPNEYSVWLSPQDRARYEGVEEEVIEELAAYLLEHARQEAFVLATPPRVSIHTDEHLALGEFGISAQLTKPAERPAREGRGGARGDARDARPRVSPPAPETAQPPRGAGETMIWSSSEDAVLVHADGRREPLPTAGVTIGRSRACEIVVDDQGVSRRHAAIRSGQDGWVLEDLGSTNGSSVNGAPVEGTRALADGDKIEIGS